MPFYSSRSLARPFIHEISCHHRCLGLLNKCPFRMVRGRHSGKEKLERIDSCHKLEFIHIHLSRRFLSFFIIAPFDDGDGVMAFYCVCLL
jgi:hypothetical protein